MKKMIWLLLFLIGNIHAAGCQSYYLMRFGINMQLYGTCKQLLLSKCAVNGTYPNLNCVVTTAGTSRYCNEIRQLAQILRTTPVSLNVEKIAAFYLVDQTFKADGQHIYYILAPGGCLIKTIIDPRVLNADLKWDYRNTSFMMVNTQKPTYVQLADGTQSFIVILKITNTCLTCPVIGWAKVQYNFNQNGQFQNIKFLSFGKTPPTTP